MSEIYSTERFDIVLYKNVPLHFVLYTSFVIFHNIYHFVLNDTTVLLCIVLLAVGET